MSSRCRDAAMAVALACCASASIPAPAREAARPAEPLRVCADPHNLPQSHADGSGYEDRIAAVLAQALGRPLLRVQMPLRRGFVRKTIGEGHCDVLMGVPAGFERLSTTRPYLRSGYVFANRESTRQPLLGFDHPRLPSLRIGLQLPGDDRAATPPGHMLARQGAGAGVVGYTPYGEEPAVQRMLQALQAGALDAVIAWGPQAGPLVQQTSGSWEPLRWSFAPAGQALPGLPFEFDIAVGVQKGQTALRDALQQAMDARRVEIEAILDEAGVPRLPLEPRP